MGTAELFEIHVCIYFITDSKLEPEWWKCCAREAVVENEENPVMAPAPL